MTSIVTYAHRTKRPPRKKAKAATLTGPAVVRAELPTAGKVNAKAAGELHPSDGKPAAVARAKHDARDRRNRAIVKRLAAGTSPRAVGAEFGLTAKRICQIHMQVTGARLRPPYASWPANHVARLRLLWRRGLSTAEIGRLLGVSEAVVGKIDRLELPPPSGELQARKRRRSGRRPSGPPTASPSCASFGASCRKRRSLASWVSPRPRSSARRAGSLCRRAGPPHPFLHDQRIVTTTYSLPKRPPMRRAKFCGDGGDLGQNRACWATKPRMELLWPPAAIRHSAN